MRHNGVLTLPAAPSIGARSAAEATGDLGPPPITRGLTWALAIYITIAVSKINEYVPASAVIRPAKILALVVLFAAFGSPLRERLRLTLSTPSARAVIAIALLMVLSVPFSIWPSHSLAFFSEQGTQTFFLFVFAAAAFTDRRAAPLLIGAWVLSTGLGGLRMLLPGAPMEAGRVMMSRAFDPNESAALLVCTLPFAGWMATRRGASRLVGLAFVGVAILAIVRSGSRGGLIGLGFMGLVMLWVSPPRKRLAYVLAAVVGLAIVLGTASDDLRTRMASVFSGDKTETDYNFTDREGRIQIWTRGIHYMVTHPLVGVGVDAFETAELTLSGKTNEGYGVRSSAAHNSLVQIGAELGVFGLLAYLTTVVTLGFSLWRARQRASRAARQAPGLGEAEIALTSTALTSLVGIFITGFFLSFGYHSITIFVFATGIGIAVGSRFALGGGAGEPTVLPPVVSETTGRSRRMRRASWRMGDPEDRAPRRYRGS